MSLAAFIHGVRVFVHQVRCHHDLRRGSVTTVGGPCVAVMVCERCGWTDLDDRPDYPG